MRICLIARNRFHHDRKATVAYRILSKAGHDVVIVAVDSDPPRDPVVRTVGRRSSNRWLRAAQRRAPWDFSGSFLRRMKSAAAATDADIYIPLHKDMLEVAIAAAHGSGGVVLRTPQMSIAGDVDLIALAPRHPELACPPPGSGSLFTPADQRAPYQPARDRFRGEMAVLCYRKTSTNPGRYIESALRRAGMRVQVETEAIDLDAVAPDTRFILFVESPYPAIDVLGSTEVPVLFWVHHGEHHLHPNLRLVDRYHADAVLLAHSWHLAPWFPTPLHRFPFAVPPELVAPTRRLAERRFDVAMVGSKLQGDAWQYQRRAALVEAIESHLPPDRVRFVEGVSPEEMTALYGESRIVLNEGGIRHYPITMRVFEAIGSGAALLTDEPPGLDMVFEPELEYARLTGEVTSDVDRLLSDLETTQEMSDRAQDSVQGRHTYDHRVDELIAIASETPKREIPPSPATGELARLIDHDVEVQRLVHDGVAGLAEQLPDREVWTLSEREGRLAPGSMDAVALTSEEAATKEELLNTARRYIYVGIESPYIEAYLQSTHPDAIAESAGRLRRVDLMSESYRARPGVRPR